MNVLDCTVLLQGVIQGSFCRVTFHLQHLVGRRAGETPGHLPPWSVVTHRAYTQSFTGQSHGPTVTRGLAWRTGDGTPGGQPLLATALAKGA